MSDQLDNIVIQELPCFSWDSQLFDVSEYIEHINIVIGELRREKLYYKGDLAALIEIEWEISLLHELRSSTLRFNHLIKKYHEERK
jgi:hypothetical protein